MKGIRIENKYYEYIDSSIQASLDIANYSRAFTFIFDNNKASLQQPSATDKQQPRASHEQSTTAMSTTA